MRCQLVTYIREKNGIKNTFVIDNMFSFQVAIDIIRNDKDPEQKKLWMNANIIGQMERNNPNRAKLVSKTRSIWTYSPNA